MSTRIRLTETEAASIRLQAKKKLSGTTLDIWHENECLSTALSLHRIITGATFIDLDVQPVYDYEYSSFTARNAEGKRFGNHDVIRHHQGMTELECRTCGYELIVGYKQFVTSFQRGSAFECKKCEFNSSPYSVSLTYEEWQEGQVDGLKCIVCEYRVATNKELGLCVLCDSVNNITLSLSNLTIQEYLEEINE